MVETQQHTKQRVKHTSTKSERRVNSREKSMCEVVHKRRVVYRGHKSKTTGEECVRVKRCVLRTQEENNKRESVRGSAREETTDRVKECAR